MISFLIHAAKHSPEDAITVACDASGLPGPLPIIEDYAVELKPWIRGFIKARRAFAKVSPILLFSNIEALAGSVAEDCSGPTPSLQPVPKTFRLITGTVCKNFSRLSPIARSFAHCVKSGDGPSGATTESIVKLCERHRPLTLSGEQVYLHCFRFPYSLMTRCAHRLV